MREPIPRKGAVLTQISAFWFERLAARRPVALRHRADRARSSGAMPALAGPGRGDRGTRDARAADDAGAVRVRGRADYLSGSAWAEYRPARARWPASRCPAGLEESDRLEPPLFSPGHQGGERPRRERDLRPGGRRARPRAGDPAPRRELRASTGPAATTPPRAGSSSPTPSSSSAPTPDGALLLIDEVHDARTARASGRPTATRPGRSQPSFDKQPLRDYLAGVKAAGPLERRGAAAAAPGRGRRRHQPSLPRGVPPAHRARPGGRGVIRTAPEGRVVHRRGVGGGARADRGRGPVGIRRAGSLAAVLWSLLAVWVVAFFRDPERAVDPRRAPGRGAGRRQGGERGRGGRAGVLRRAARSGSRSS